MTQLDDLQLMASVAAVNIRSTVVSGTWARAHPDLVKRFSKAMSQAGVWANKNQAESGTMLTKYMKIAVVPGMKRTIYAAKLDPALVQPLIDGAAKYGITKATFPATDIISPDAR